MKHARRIVATVLLIAVSAACLCLILCGIVMIHYRLGLDSDQQALSRMMSRHLHRGISFSASMSFLYSPLFLKVEQAHGFEAATGDLLTPVRETHYIDGYPGYEVYPDGSSVRVERDSVPYGTALWIQLFFDARGHLIRFSVSEYWAGI